MSPENTHKPMGFYLKVFNTRRCTLVHGFCFFKLFLIGLFQKFQQLLVFNHNLCTCAHPWFHDFCPKSVDTPDQKCGILCGKYSTCIELPDIRSSRIERSSCVEEKPCANCGYPQIHYPCPWFNEYTYHHNSTSGSAVVVFFRMFWSESLNCNLYYCIAGLFRGRKFLQIFRGLLLLLLLLFVNIVSPIKCG